MTAAVDAYALARCDDCDTLYDPFVNRHGCWKCRAAEAADGEDGQR